MNEKKIRCGFYKNQLETWNKWAWTENQQAKINTEVEGYIKCIKDN